MKLQIDIPHRYACMRAHTATHLLHAELWKIFPQTKQAGSYVGPDELRFDFFAERSLTIEELQHISQQINTSIINNYPVSVAEMSYEDAIKTGAKAFFEDTYPEIVRVVSIWSGLSVELCGGTHVSETSQIGSFFITEQTAVAAGIKRITALTGPKVSSHAQSLQSDLESIATKISVPVKQLDAKIEKLMTEHQQSQKLILSLAKEYINTLPIVNISFHTSTLKHVICLDTDMIAWSLGFSTVVDSLRGTQAESRLVYTNAGQYALFHPQAKKIAQEVGIKWGGSDSFVQGRDEKIVQLLTH